MAWRVSPCLPAPVPVGCSLEEELLPPQLLLLISSTPTQTAQEINSYLVAACCPHRVVPAVWNVIQVVRMRVILRMQKFACGWMWDRLQTLPCVSRKHRYHFLGEYY